MKKNNKKIAAIIVAAGKGERFGGAVPKQFLPLLGKSVVQWSVETFKSHPLVSDVVVVTDAILEGIETTPGGDSRQASVRRGLEYLRGKKPDLVLVHDAARPLVTPALITRLCEEAEDAAIPGLAVTDTVKRDKGHALTTEDRNGLYTVQTPQAFRFDLIDTLHQKYQAQSFTDDAALCEADNVAVKIVAGQRDNIKITRAEDLPAAEQYFLSRLGDVRTGQGYDVHRFVAGRPLMLCGVDVPHDKGLEGHSDADVGLHAITDAVLGTIGAADIGAHFSPKDARWKNADSAAFLKHAAGLVAARGGVISHVDVTLICEAPKIGPHRETMRQRIADILSLNVERVSVKATTTEGLGFTGRGEGIAAQATVTVRLPFIKSPSPLAGEGWDEGYAPKAQGFIKHASHGTPHPDPLPQGERKKE